MKIKKQQTIADQCLICGEFNALGLHADFYEMEDNKVVALATFRPEHQSYPNRTHGGMISALLDEAIGRTLWTVEPDVFAVTTSLSVKFRRPVPCGVELRCVAELLTNASRGFTARADLLDADGKILASGEGVYAKVPNDMVDADAKKMHLPHNLKNIKEIEY
ncbi:MAG: PaaI family thioesterase [Clostridia bacterium]|nr:PaaI family thioesterase [Clostridia bacterium]